MHSSANLATLLGSPNPIEQPLAQHLPVIPLAFIRGHARLDVELGKADGVGRWWLPSFRRLPRGVESDGVARHEGLHGQGLEARSDRVMRSKHFEGVQGCFALAQVAPRHWHQADKQCLLPFQYPDLRATCIATKRHRRGRMVCLQELSQSPHTQKAGLLR